MNDCTLAQYDRVEATFAPLRTDDLQNDAADWIGKRLVWMAAWEIEEGPYTGQWSMTVDLQRASQPWPSFSWVPLCDLADMKTVR